MLGLWVGLITLTVSEQLHQALHDEADHPEHECPVTTVAKADLLHTPPASLVPAPTLAVSSLLFAAPLAPAIRMDRRLDSGRAPPRFVVPS